MDRHGFYPHLKGLGCEKGAERLRERWREISELDIEMTSNLWMDFLLPWFEYRRVDIILYYIILKLYYIILYYKLLYNP